MNGLKAIPHHTIAKNSALWKHKFKNVGPGAGEKDQWVRAFVPLAEDTD